MSELIAAHRGKLIAAVTVVLIAAFVLASRGGGPSDATVKRAADSASAGLARNRDAATGAAAEGILQAASNAMETMYAERQTFDGALAALPSVEPNISWVAGPAADASRNEVAVAVTGPAAYTLTSGLPGGATYSYARDAAGTVTKTCGPGCTW